MRQSSLCIVVLLSLVVTVFAVSRTGVSGDQSRLRRSAGASHITAENFFSNPAVLRWRNAEPTHWRALVLHR